MNRTCKAMVVVGVVTGLIASLAGAALANGGPFVVKYPSGDPAAKGVIARLDPDLKPARETRLRVVKEDLTVNLDQDRFFGSAGEQTPLAEVTAAYTIENPTAKQIDVDFGFPVLRGIYMNPMSMSLTPDVQVRLDGKSVRSTVISNSAIYGIIRQKARRTIHEAIEANRTLYDLTMAVRKSEGTDRDKARAALLDHATRKMKWNPRDAALLVEYASVEVDGQGKTPIYPDVPRSHDESIREIARANLGPLSAVGEQKATQFLAQLASRFDRRAAATYESIFEAWGGDVRERALDLKTGKLRPREITVDPKAHPSYAAAAAEPTIYARVDYLDSDKLTEAEKASCKAILKNLPVVFTFAPMNLLHYQVSFPAKSKQVLTVTYKQYCYADTRNPESYQLAYVLHPASLWKSFGPIKLKVTAPWGVDVLSSSKCARTGSEERPARPNDKVKSRYAIYRSTVKSRKGELYLAIKSDQWKKIAGANEVAPTQVTRKAEP